MLDSEEAIQKWKDFEARANTKRSKQVERIKSDRTFLSGDQWEEEDDNLIPKDRSRRTVNVLANSVNSTVNGYAAYPYKWYCAEDESDTLLEAFLKFGSNARAAYDVLYNTVAFGLGYFALGSETVSDGAGSNMEVPALYSVERVENVFWDPDSVEMDGRDAQCCGIVEYKSKDYIESKYGADFVTDKGVRPVVNTTANENSDTMVLVTFFRMENGKCAVYRLLNNRFLEDPVELDIPRLPVFPSYGERTFDGDNTLFQGLVNKGKGIQKMLNYAFTQLAERMAQAPKPTFMTTADAVEGYVEGWKNFGKNMNPLAIYNRLADDGKTVLEPPQRIDNQVQYGDITAIIEANLNLLSTITGVDSKGLVDGAPETTATEVLYNERQTRSTIRHYFANMRDSFRAVGEVILKLFNVGDGTPVETVQGPDEYMEKQLARAELMNIGNMVADQDKMKIVDGILMTHNDNPILKRVYGELHRNPAPTAMEQQAFDTIEQMKQALDQKNQEIQQMQETIRNYESQERATDKSNAFELKKMELEHAYSMEDEILKAQLNSGADADKADIQNARDIMKIRTDAESMALKLDGQKMDLAMQGAKNAMELNKKKVMDGLDIEAARKRAEQAGNKPEVKNDED